MRCARSLPLACLLVAGCAAPELPRKIGRQAPSEHVRVVATQWLESTDDDGSLSGDPRGIQGFHIHTERRVKLLPDDRFVETIERTEVFDMTSGARFECVTRGPLDGIARYTWSDQEVRVTLENAPDSHPRNCKPDGFPVARKDYPRVARVFALREDRLVGVDKHTRKNILVPTQ